MNMGKKETARLIINYIHRAMMHHALWYAEVEHQFGREKALEIMQKAFDRSYEIQMKRLGKALGFEMEDGLPSPMLKMNMEELDRLKNSIAINWLVNDGVWFQAVEFTRGMNDAKRCNDSCWAKFSPFEAWSVKQFLNLPERPGLEGLKKALNYRLYASINIQSIVDETQNSFVFRMNECRVQVARKRKGLKDYPCKSGGLVEYTTFAEAIDPMIRTECLACPPDPHPDDYYCSWKFYIE
ncbi:MAG: cytosolic protein [Bacteroidetes bacterium]|nr:cytosolic protein [Bacteroidota bacterium]